jgi:hypothetical protein
MDGVLILLVGALLFCAVVFGAGIAVGRFILVSRNTGEALVANTLAQLSCPHVLIKNVTLKPRMLWGGSR